ncbi:unannotated protein [freshwater metagenome]|uniref:Unannotated protein n=1 Tax=freshwater metagenome TaxID=449393 RepID=A0A6J7KQC6_9ZZZZ
MPKTSSGRPENGISANVASAKTIEISGAPTNSQPIAPRGLNCSLKSSLPMSASGWSEPYTPTRLGPGRFWKRPSSLRSYRRTSGTRENPIAKIRNPLMICAHQGSA